MKKYCLAILFTSMLLFVNISCSNHKDISPVGKWKIEKIKKWLIFNEEVIAEYFVVTEKNCYPDGDWAPRIYRPWTYSVDKKATNVDIIIIKLTKDRLNWKFVNGNKTYYCKKVD